MSNSPYLHDVPRLKAEIVAQVDAGAFLKTVCAAPGMPSVLTVRTWARTDAFFGEALAAARARGTWRRQWVIDEAVAADFLARARAGAPIRSLLGQPGMPSQTAYRRWKIADPPFAEAAFALLQRRNARGREWGHGRRRAFDPAVADRIVARLHKARGLKALLRNDPELPSREVVARWRREQPEFDRVLKRIIAAWRAKPRPVPAEVAEDILEHIVEGGSFASYSRQPGAPSFNTLRSWMRDPDFAWKVGQACEWREDWYHDQIELLEERLTPGSVAAIAPRVGKLKRHLVRLRHRPTKPLQPERRGKRGG